MLIMNPVVRTLEVTGPTSPAACWQRYDELDRWADWAPHITSVESPASRLSPGVTGVVRVLGGLHVPFVITDVDRPAMTWSWIARLGPVRLTLHHGVHPAPHGTRTSLAIEGPRLVVDGYAPLARVALHRLVA